MTESETEVDKYLRLPEGYESRPSSPEPDKTRELELTAVYRQKTTTTTKTDVAQKLLDRYLVADASVQTSAGDELKGTDKISVESHFEVPLERFEEVLLSGKRSSTDLDEAVDSVLQNPNFQYWMETYFRAMDRDSSESPPPLGAPGGDPQEHLVHALNLIMSSCPDSNDVRPYNLRFVLIDDFLEIPEPHEPPQVAAILDFGVEGPWDWGDVALPVQFSAFDFETELEDSRRQFEAGMSRQGGMWGTHDPGTSRATSPSRKRSVSPSISNDEAHLKRARSGSFLGGQPRVNHEVDSSRGPAGREAPPVVPSHAAEPCLWRRVPKPPAELARCALEVLRSKGNRRHVLGISLADHGARFWFFDRAGSICTPQLIMNEGPFVGALMKFSFCNATHLGLEGAFVPPEGSLLPPLNVVKAWTIAVQGSSFIIDELLHCADELYGRGTTVFSADGRISEIVDASRPTSARVVLKLSWQPTNWQDEDALYRLAADRGVEGISRLYRSAALARLSSGFRGRLIDKSQFYDRELRAQILGPLCIPLYKVDNVDTFKTAFISLVKAHHQLYEKAGILHHDISVNNLMVDANDHSAGVLIDLDLAVRLKDGEHWIPFEPVPAGTLAFRAIDILRQGELVRTIYYRHDLESFFYTLVWILAYHAHSFSTPVRDLALWCDGVPMVIADRKRGCLIQPNTVLPEGPLKSLWLLKLARMLNNGYDQIRPVLRGDVATMGGQMTYDTFMAILDPPE